MDENHGQDNTNGHCYYLTPSLTFSDAVSRCRDRNSDLAAITSHEIKEDLEFLMEDGASTIWIGGTSIRWVWKQHGNSHDHGSLVEGLFLIPRMNIDLCKNKNTFSDEYVDVESNFWKNEIEPFPSNNLCMLLRGTDGISYWNSEDCTLSQPYICEIGGIS